MGMMEFYTPCTLKEAKDLVDIKRGKLLAGGTDLVLELQKNKINCDTIISLENLVELKGITERNDEIVIGAMATFTDMQESEVIRKHLRALYNCCTTMGSPQIRNMATLGGNIMNAGSAADAIPCVIAHNGLLVIESNEMTRVISCEEYFKNYNSEKIRGNEILTKVILPKEGHYTGYYKLGKRNSLAIARISVAVSIKIEKDIVEDMRVCLGAVGRYAFRAKEFEKLSIGKDLQWLYSEEALRELEKSVEESIKGRKTMPFKREAVKGVFKEALILALKD